MGSIVIEESKQFNTNVGGKELRTKCVEEVLNHLKEIQDSSIRQVEDTFLSTSYAY
jgi:hypothetical protein